MLISSGAVGMQKRLLKKQSQTMMILPRVF